MKTRTSKRRELTAHEKAVAATTKKLWLARKKRDRLNQDDAAEALEFSTSAFSQYINGAIPMGTDAVKKFADYLGVHPTDIDEQWLGGTAGIAENSNVYRIAEFDRMADQLSEDEIFEDIMAAINTMPVDIRAKIAKRIVDGLAAASSG